jgi:hypothetical protein
VKHTFISTLKRWLHLNFKAKHRTLDNDHPFRPTERQMDKTLADSFPASDPPPWH